MTEAVGDRGLYLGTRSWPSHAAAGFVACVLAVFPTSFAEFALAFAGIAALIHHRRWFASLRDAARLPVVWAVPAYFAWAAISLLWSPDRSLGLEEVGAARFWVLTLCLLPLADRRSVLIAGLVTGFAAGHVVQLLNLWSLHGDGPEWASFGRNADRVSGWWDPAVSGTMLAAATALHLPAALRGTGRWIWIGLAGFTITWIGLILTGARGGWLAAGFTTIVAALPLAAGSLRDIASKRRPRNLRSLAVIGTFAAAMVFVLGGGPLVPENIRSRIDGLTQAVSSPSPNGIDYTTADGARIAMKQTAIDAFLANPIAGTGAGGYRAWVGEHANPDRYGRFVLDHRVGDHAHDTILHTAATLGTVGLAIPLLGLIAIPLARTLRRGNRLPRSLWLDPDTPTDARIYHAGPGLALVALAAATPFDTLQASNASTAVLCVIAALVMMPRIDSPNARETQPRPSAM